MALFVENQDKILFLLFSYFSPLLLTIALCTRRNNKRFNKQTENYGSPFRGKRRARDLPLSIRIFRRCLRRQR